MTDLLLGAIDNYDLQTIKPWILSAKEHIPDTLICLITYRASQEVLEWLTQQEIVTYQCGYNEKLGQQFSHVFRFFSAWQFLARLETEFDYVMMTDVSDIIFQSNPFEYLKKELNDKKIIAVSEGIIYDNEEWGKDTFIKAFGYDIYGLEMRDKICRNVGILGGKLIDIKNLCLSIFQVAKSSLHYPGDQQAYNLLVYTMLHDITKFVSHEDTLAVNAGTCLDNTKAWLFDKNCERLPILTDRNTAANYKGEDVAIFHQWTRTILKDYIIKKYV